MQTERCGRAEHLNLNAQTGSNLVMALAGKAGERVEPFQSLTQDESADLPDDPKQAVAHEIADTQNYLVALCSFP